jgi:hypothetical protein
MRALVLVVAVISCALFGMAARGHGADYERETLRDVGPFKVSVIKLGDSAIAYRLNRNAIEAAVELRLRRNGIKLDDKSSSRLEVFVTAIPFGSDITVWTLNLEFWQPVTVEVNGVSTLVPTWREECVRICPPSETRAEVMDTIDGFVDQFINDYLAANEKVEAGAGR